MKTITEKKTKSGLLSRPEPRSMKTLPKIDFALRQVNRSLRTANLLALLQKDTPCFYAVAEVVGKWVWIAFAGKQLIEITRSLAELGFHWNHTRKTWQHPCGTKDHDRATYDPRKRYGSFYPAKRKTTLESATRFATTATVNATKTVMAS